MKPIGYYDLLLKLSDQIKTNYFVKKLVDLEHNMVNFDDYLIRQFNALLKEHLQTIKKPEVKITFLNQLLANFSNNQFCDEVLLAIKDQEKVIEPIMHPIRLSDNYLFTNDNEQALVSYLISEIISCDQVYLIYPFISRSMLNKLRSAFKTASKKAIPIFLISTTFDEQALFVNLYELENLITEFPNITVRIEDNTEKRSERIHIKAALFHRDSGFSSALLGSSNLTIKGMQTGREWNIKINEFTNYDLYHNLKLEYERIWNDNLVTFNEQKIRKQLLQRLQANKNDKNGELCQIKFKKYYLYDFQVEILKILQTRRKIGKQKHLLVMATGTGKTIISAFDYLQQIAKKAYQRPKILFIAHQKEIIMQALVTFRAVLKDENFGAILDPKIANFHCEYLFATIQTIYRHLKCFAKNQFDYIVFDEAHHIVAKTFARIFNYFQPQEVIGLTATPEREDEQSILPYFDYEIAYELRLWTAINQRLLAKFDYYCIDDIVDLKGVDINNEQLVFHHLNKESRNFLLLEVIKKYIGLYHRPTALIFCINTEHAEIIANFLKTQNLQAAYLTSKNSYLRTAIINDFKAGKINYLCVVNIFNEGIDVPQTDTLIFLRPTNSRTIYLQQLGRGLRKTADKNKLVIYDLISNIDQRYDIITGIKNLLHKTDTYKSYSTIFSGYELPNGCTITLEPRSREIILNNLSNWYKVTNRLYAVIKVYYQKYQEQGLVKILEDHALDILTFYQTINNFYLFIALGIKEHDFVNNKTKRNKNILKQFLFLNDFEIINYFYLRLKVDIKLKINYEYDNLLVCSLYYEVSSLASFIGHFSNILTSNSDIISIFINDHKIIVKELLIILEYKLTKQKLQTNNHANYEYPLLAIKATYTIRQALVAIKRLNFINSFGPLKIIAFQAGYLTYEQNKSVIFADIDGFNYGKLTKYDDDKKEFYWSIPENKTINSKLVSDLQNPRIRKFLFLKTDINQKYDKLGLKLYNYIGEGHYLTTITEKYITIKLKVIN